MSRSATAAAADQSQEDVQSGNEDVEDAGKQNQRTGYRAVGVRRAEDHAGGIDQRQNTERPDAQADQNSDQTDVEKAIENHDADKRSENADHQAARGGEFSPRAHDVERDADEDAGRDSQGDQDERWCVQARHPEQRRQSDSRDEPVEHQSGDTQLVIVPHGDGDLGNEIE